MLKYKNDSTSCTTEILKMYFSFISIYLQNTGENASYLSLCLCVPIFHRKIKIKNKCKFQGETGLVCSLLPAVSLRYSIEMRLLVLLVSRGDESCMGTSAPHFRL